jgi:hypothetical protein
VIILGRSAIPSFLKKSLSAGYSFAKHFVVFFQKQKRCFWLGREPGLQILGRHVDVIGFAMRKLIFSQPLCREEKLYP